MQEEGQEATNTVDCGATYTMFERPQVIVLAFRLRGLPRSFALDNVVYRLVTPMPVVECSIGLPVTEHG